MKIAVQGCAHGELENIYNTIEYIEKQNNITIDLLLCCGDFQATRNLDDLKSMAVPPKFRSLCTFYKYFSGEKLAPKLTIFVGGNHEASNYLQELPYGGWVAPNIYYLGYAGVVNVAGIRIAGLSGIFKGWDFAKGRFEVPPYNDETLRSCYHIRNIDVFRLKQLSPPVHIMLSHDWPAGITNHGNVQQLLKNKPYFKEEIENNTLGNKPTAELLEYIKPDYWFAAHLHVKFAALVEHKDESETKVTKFLALDKCLPKRKFLQILDIPHESTDGIQLKYDLEWLTILHLTNHLLSVKKLNTYMPGPGSDERWIFTPTKDELDLVMNKFQNDLIIPNNFVPTAPAHNQSSENGGESEGKVIMNPQTVELCSKLCIDDPISLIKEDSFNRTNTSINMSNFDSSSFIRSDLDISSSSSSPACNSSFSKPTFSRTPLKLPAPNFQIPEEPDDRPLTSTPVDKVGPNSFESGSKGLFDENESEKPKSPSREQSEAEASPWPKKFRRRNIDLFTSTDDD